MGLWLPKHSCSTPSLDGPVEKKQRYDYESNSRSEKNFTSTTPTLHRGLEWDPCNKQLGIRGYRDQVDVRSCSLYKFKLWLV